MADVPDGAPPLRQAFTLMRNSSSSLICPVFKRLEDDSQRHELAHAGRRHQLVGVVLEQHCARIGIHQDRLAGLGGDFGLRLRGGRGRKARKRHRQNRQGPQAAGYARANARHGASGIHRMVDGYHGEARDKSTETARTQE